MVQIANIITTVVASVAVVNASQQTKRATEAVGATEVKAAVENYASLLSNLAANVGNGGEAPSNVDLKAGLDTFMNMMSAVTQLQAPKPAANVTAFNPNWEGAIIGAAIAAQFGALSGALLGVYTDWTFKGFEAGLTNALGFDPIAMLTGAAPPPAAPPVTLGNGAGAPLASAPKSPATAPAPAAPKPAAPVAPAAAPVAPKPAAPPAAASPAPKMSGMSGMSGHAHGASVGAQDFE